jgi:hypothetical protein
MRGLVFFGLLCCCSAAAERLECMVWMCLERCNETSADIAESLSQLNGPLRHAVTTVAFELYNLGPNGQLVTIANLSNVGPKLSNSGFRTYPMISSYPYPPAFLSWMRQLWQTPSVGQAFIAQLRSEAQTHGWTGFQVDWEPTATATPQDAEDYAAFLSTMADALHPVLIMPTVATWNAIWNLTAIGQSRVHKVLTMSTYASQLSTFEQRLDMTLKSVSANLLGVGVENWPDLDVGIEQRYQMTLARGVSYFGIWKMPLSDEWIAASQKYCAVAN